MKLDLFMLAEAASALDGRLYIHGGGVTRLDVPAVPTATAQLALVARFRVVPRDLEVPHLFRLGVFAPDGQAIVPEATFGVPAGVHQLDSVDGEEKYLQLALTFGPLLLLTAGVYKLELKLDGKALRTMPLPVVARGIDFR